MGRQCLKGAVTRLLVLVGTLSSAAGAADIVSQANADFTPASASAPIRIYSNEVIAQGSAQRRPDARKRHIPLLRFFKDAKYESEDSEVTPGETLYLRADLTECDFDASRQSVWITLDDALTGDEEVVEARETPDDVGIFITEMPVDTGTEGAAQHNDGLLRVKRKDTITGTVDGCGSGIAQDWILVDPSGVVFDSQTDLPVPGAVVTLIDITGAGNNGNAGEPAIVLDYDGVTPAPSTVTVGADGKFNFPLVPESDYKIVVTPPGDYSFPSKQRAPSTEVAEQIASIRTLHASGSFGRQFQVTQMLGAVVFDIPLDSNPNGLFVQKTASRSSAGIGESVEYAVTVQNVSGITVGGASVRDSLPAGFTYVPASSRVNGTKIADPAGGKGPTLTWSLDSLPASESLKLSYRVLIGPGAIQGDGVNRAQAFGTVPALKQSNIAQATVQVDAGVFSDDSYLLGKVFADCNQNGLQDEGEPGIPGVRFYLEDGTYVISDGLGKYSLYGLKPRTHVLKADRSTLPPGVELEALNHRNGGDGNSRFVDLKAGELHRADFAIRGCPAQVHDVIASRRAALALEDGEISSGLREELKVDAQRTADVRALPASGVIGASTTNAAKSQATAASTKTAAPVPAEAFLEDLLPSLDGALGFIGLADGDALVRTQTNVRVQARAGTQLELTVNGARVPDSRIGKKVTSEQVEALEYVGLDLYGGDNELTIAARDSFGNEPGRKTIHVRAPGELDRVVLTPTATVGIADGTSYVRVSVRLEDEHGLLIPDRVPITLDTSDGEWQVIDLDANLPGTQTMIENGAAQFELLAPTTPGTVKLIASAGKIGGQIAIDFAPQLRPMIAAGVVEGAFGVRKLDPGKLQPARADDGFEQELTSLGNSNNGKNIGGARAALFLKGKVKGDYLLTLGYDSDKDGGNRLFRDIQPDKFYPVYGDSSVKGYDAQSTGHLYVRIDKNKSYLLAGDMTTQAISQARTLGAYNRSLTGVKEHFASSGAVVDVFASHSAERQIIEEIAANGTSGPYELRSGNAVENSERVEIVTRDRNQPSHVIETVTLGRFSDYEIEPFTGRLILRAPVPSVDRDLNPHSLRVTYEVDDGGDEYWTKGVDSQFQLTESFAMGAAMVDDRNPVTPLKLASSNATFKLADGTVVVAEAARSDTDEHGIGWGRRLELQHTGDALKARAFAGRTDTSFSNPSAFLSSGRTEGGAKASYSLNERTNLVGEGLFSEDVASGDRRDGGLLGVERSFASNRKFEIGARHVQLRPASPAEQATDITSVRTKLTSPIPNTDNATAFAEYEQDVQDTNRRMAAVGGDYQFANRSRFYVRHEFITSLSGPYSLDSTQRRNTTVVGLDTRYMQDDRVFSEYRIGNSLGARDAEAAVGLRNNWRIAEGVRASTSLERVEVLDGPRANEAAAVTGALEYTRNPTYKITARLELRSSGTSDGVLSTFGFAKKISEEWTFLARNVYAVTDYTAQEDMTQERLQAGFAYRDASTNRVNALMRYEFRVEDNAYESALRRDVHIFSGHINYQMSEQLVVSGQYAAKLVAESTETGDLDTNAQMIGVRATRDLGEHWDIGITARTLFSNHLHTRQQSFGAEVGYMAATNLWLSVGHNVTGFRDRDLSTGEYTNRGTYLRIKFKVDESLFDPGALDRKAGE